MPIEYDKTPGGVNKKQRRPAGEAPDPAPAPAPAAEPLRLRVRFLRPLSCRLGNFAEGQVVEVPADTARSWAGFGFVEEDKALAGPPEIKATIAVPPRKPRLRRG